MVGIKIGRFFCFPSMGVSITIYGAATGLFNNLKNLKNKNKTCVLSEIWATACLILLDLCISICGILVLVSLQLLLFMTGDIELNLGPKRSQLTLGHINARSFAIEDKFDEISSYILNESFDLFAVSETWLDKRTHSETLHISGYHSIIRKDRLYSRGGGVALYVKQAFAFKRRSDLENDLYFIYI